MLIYFSLKQKPLASDGSARGFYLAPRGAFTEKVREAPCQLGNAVTGPAIGLQRAGSRATESRARDQRQPLMEAAEMRLGAQPGADMRSRKPRASQGPSGS